MEKSKLVPFLRPQLDILFIGLNPAKGSSDNGHYFSVNQAFWNQLWEAGLILKSIDKMVADNFVFGNTKYNFNEWNFGITDLVTTIAESDSSKIKPTYQDCANTINEIKKYKPRTAILLHGKVLSNLCSYLDMADLNKIQANWKKDFQSKAIKFANIKDLKELEVFKDGKLTKEILLADSKEEKRKTINVSDLLSFFNQKPELKDNSTKSLKLRLTAEIESLPKDIKTNGTDKFEVIEITEAKDKKTKVVVLKDSFTPNDIQQLNDLKELKIYFATT